MSNNPSIDANAIAEACRRFRVRRLELFGSGARDPEHANDFDFLVDLQEMDPGKYAKDYFGLYEALRNITGKPVDFVTPEDLTNPYFKLSVEKGKRLLYAA